MLLMLWLQVFLHPFQAFKIAPLYLRCVIGGLCMLIELLFLSED